MNGIQLKASETKNDFTYYFDKKLRKIFLFCLLALICPFFLLSYFTFPSGYDDFNNANIILRVGEWEYFKDLYYSWTGRYTSSFFIVYLNPMKYKSWLSLIKMVPVVTTILLIGSTFVFFTSLINKKLSAINIWIPVLIFLLIFINQTPSVGQLVYWFTGASVYTSGLIFVLLLFSSIIKYNETNNIVGKAAFGCISFLLVILAVGTNESVLFAVLFILFLFVPISLFLKLKKLKFYYFLLLVGVISAYFSLSAPGNTLRANVVPGTVETIFSINRISKAIFHSLFYATTTVFSWVNSFVLILGSIILVPFLKSLIINNTFIYKISKINPIILLLLTIIFVAIQIFPSYLAVNDVEVRIWSSTYFFFLLSWFTIFTSCISRMSTPLYLFTKKYSIFLTTFFFSLLLFAGNSNVNKAIFELFVRAPAYKVAFDERLQVFLNSPNENVVVKPLSGSSYKSPQILFISEVSSDTSELRNISTSIFFSLKSVRLTEN